MEHIYRASWFDNKRCRVSHTDVYYLKAEHTHWIHERCWCPQVVKVEYIAVEKDSDYYKMAVNNSKAIESSSDVSL